ncbi:MAG: beta-lactamase family protein, partial [Kiritimatiellae bacterium]|nr:beta-lactamase family protein [Kiritimatiellia bacterium]
FACACACALSGAEAQLAYSTPEAEGISSRAILDWVDAAEKEIAWMHSFVLVRHGKIVASGWWNPYKREYPHRLFSHSKSFTSTAVGFAADEKKLDLDERVAAIFPDKLPANPSENALRLRVRDLLTMNVGSEGTDNFRRDPSGDWEKAFFAGDFKHEPGTRFKYDSSATYMLASIVERKTGRKMMEYLHEKFFDPVGITSVYTTYSPSGVPCGGWGMAMTTEELARFGQFYLQRGAWEGKQLLSRDWATLATTKQTASGWGGPDQPDSDWYQGYCFQFWRCRHNAFRADGAGGQFTIVMPDQDAVFCGTALFGDFQGAFNTIWKHVLPAFKDAPLAEDPEALKRLRDKCASLELPLVKGSKTGVVADAKTWKLKPNARGITALSFAPDAEGWTLAFACADGERQLAVGAGKWRAGELQMSRQTCDPLGAYGLLGRVATAANGAWTAPGVFEAELYFTREAARGSVKIDVAGGKMKAKLFCGGACLKDETCVLEEAD